LISNVTGSVAGEEIATAHYWREHVRATVQFERGVEALIEHGCDAVIEVGATATLLGLIAALPESHRMLTVASLRRNAGQWQQILTAAATLEVNGIDLDWLAFDAPYGRCRVPLPTYPFQRSRFWFDSDAEPVAAETIRRSAASPVYLDLGNDQVIAAGIVRDFVRKQIRNLLGLPVETPIAGGQRLHDLGVDSFGAVELRHRLQAVFGPAIVLPMTLFLDHPTVDAVAAFIAGQVFAAEAEPIDNVIGDLAALTDEEAEALLLGELLEVGTR
jgi:acyl carrier protein